MRSSAFQHFSIIATLAILFLACSVPLLYNFSIHWPMVALFSDLKSLASQERIDSRDLYKWRFAFACSISSALLTCIWLFYRQYRKQRYAFLLGALTGLLFFVLIFYPWIRQKIMNMLIIRDLTTITIELVDNSSLLQLPRPIRLVLGRLPDESSWETIGWFSNAEICHIELSAEVIRNIAKRSDFFALPSELELNAGFAHDWSRVSFLAPNLSLQFSVLGLRRTGLHSRRLLNVNAYILQQVLEIPVEFPVCAQRLEQLLYLDSKAALASRFEGSPSKDTWLHELELIVQYYTLPYRQAGMATSHPNSCT